MNYKCKKISNFFKSSFEIGMDLIFKERYSNIRNMNIIRIRSNIGRYFDDELYSITQFKNELVHGPKITFIYG